MKTHCSKLLWAFIPAALLAMTACSDDDNDKPIGQLPEKTYTGVKVLDLEYCGHDMAGKSVTFTPSGSDAVLTLESKLNLGEIIPALSKLPEIQGPGVLPGSPIVKLPVKLNPDGKEYSFSGNAETDYLTYSYEGEVNPDSLELEIENVKLKDKSLAGGVWKPAPVKEELGVIPVESPLHIVWETSSDLQLGDLKMSPQQILQLVANLPLISVYNGTAKMSLAEAICQIVKTVAFVDNGNIVITYVNTANGAAQLMTAPQNMIQYVVAAPGIVKVFPNPVDIYAQYLVNQPQKPHPGVSFSKNKTKAGISSILEIESVVRLIQQLVPMIAEGFPMEYKISGDSMALYFNNDMLIPLMKGLVPVLTDPAVASLIMEALQKQPELTQYLPVIESALKSLPAMIEGTTSLQLGLNLVKY